MTIVKTVYRYKRPPARRKAQPAAVTGPAVVTARSPTEIERMRRWQPETAPAEENTAPQPAPKPQHATIVTARKPGTRRPASPDLEMSRGEHNRRGDAADELWRDLVRRVTSGTE